MGKSVSLKKHSGLIPRFPPWHWHVLPEPGKRKSCQMHSLNQSASLRLPAVSSFTDGPSWQQTHTDKCQFSECQFLFILGTPAPTSQCAVFWTVTSPRIQKSTGVATGKSSKHHCLPEYLVVTTIEGIIEGQSQILSLRLTKISFSEDQTNFATGITAQSVLPKLFSSSNNFPLLQTLAKVKAAKSACRIH